jgi:ribose transport system ATP-binding protein
MSDEIIGVCDRIAVMREGRISGQLERAQFSEHNVLHLAVGAPLALNKAQERSEARR